MPDRSHEGPPPEAYSRVSNPERFQLLHEFALNKLIQLEKNYQVRREERTIQ
jgi:hypothetical protein